ncbi:MAG: NHL repeat-containing protein [bacterium]|nr:NHL repeat-containing protein [bacterium]
MIAKIYILIFLLVSGIQAEAQERVIATFRFVAAFGQPGNGQEQFFQPEGLALDAIGNLYVADTGNHRIQKFDAQGRYVVEVGGFGWDPGQFNRPIGVAAGSGLEVYVADSRNNRIQVFDRNLRLLAVVGGKDADGPVEMGNLGGIVVSERDEVYVSDLDLDQMVQIDSYSRVDRSFGGYGYGDGRLRRPLGLAVDTDGATYVCDSENGRVVKFDRFGNFQRELGKEVLSEPAGVCLGPRGTLVVADLGYHRVVVFDLKSGEVAGHIGGPEAGKGPMTFHKPRDVVMGKQGTLYILDSGNSRVQRIQVLVSRK